MCDCPGLVFPSKVPKVLQVLMGCFPIAQLREPFTTIKFLAENLDLQTMLRLQHPENDDEWSAMDICEAWAKKRGFVTAKAARLDTYRAANNLLRFALDGKICLCLKPPKFFEKKQFWCNHPDNETVRWILGNVVKQEAGDYHESSDEESGGELKAESGASTNSDSDSNEDNMETSDNEEPLRTNKFAALSAE